MTNIDVLDGDDDLHEFKDVQSAIASKDGGVRVSLTRTEEREFPDGTIVAVVDRSD